MAIEAGVGLKTVQEMILGHSTANTTVNIYARIQKQKVAGAGKALNGMYGIEAG